jgi:hypothetical protein
MASKGKKELVWADFGKPRPKYRFWASRPPFPESSQPNMPIDGINGKKGASLDDFKKNIQKEGSGPRGHDFRTPHKTLSRMMASKAKKELVWAIAEH